MPDTPVSSDFQIAPAPGGGFPALIGDPGEETAGDTPETGVDRSELARPRYPSLDRWVHVGQWDGFVPLVTQLVSNQSANTLYAWPFPSNGGGLVYQMAVSMSGASGAGETIRLGLYAPTSLANIYPGRRIFDSGPMAIDVSTVVSVTVNKSIRAQTVYWATLIRDSVSSAGTYHAGTAVGSLGYSALSSLETPARLISVSFTYGALPATFPSGGTVGNHAGGSQVPIFIKFREA